MNRTAPIEVIEQDQLKLNMYSDGDVLIEIPTAGYLQLRADTLRALASRLPNPRPPTGGTPITVSAEKPNSWAPTPSVASHGEEDKPTESEAQTPRNVKKTHRGWECTVRGPGMDGTDETTVYIYESRDHARKGKFEHNVGEEGRLA